MISAETERHAHLLSEMLEFVRTSLRASASVFYWIGPDRTTIEVAQKGFPEHFSDRYHEGELEADPLLARRLAENHKKVACLTDEQRLIPQSQALAYMRFLGEFGFIDATDLVFWRGDIPFGGIGVLKRHDDPPTSEETLHVAAAMQRYLECDLKYHPVVREAHVFGLLEHRYGLTKREIEVLRLVCDGASNSDISSILCISLSTVKTHLIRCFDKLGVKSRAAAMSMFLRPELMDR